MLQDARCQFPVVYRVAGRLHSSLVVVARCPRQAVFRDEERQSILGALESPFQEDPVARRVLLDRVETPVR